MAFERSRIELLYFTNAGCPVTQCRSDRIIRIAQRRTTAQGGDDHAFSHDASPDTGRSIGRCCNFLTTTHAQPIPIPMPLTSSVRPTSTLLSANAQARSTRPLVLPA